MSSAEEEKDYFTRKYYCRICNEDHLIMLSKNMINEQEKYPFSFIFLHGELKNILTILYIDKEGQIRGVDVNKLKDDDLFSKDHVVSITTKLIEEIESLREENEYLKEEIHKLKKE